MLNFEKLGKKNISFVGLMGSGKSIVAKKIARLAKLKLYDTDKLIEKEAGQSIEDIFRERGENHFRKLEEKIVINVLNQDNCVISLGGGSILSKNVRKIIEKNSFSIYLKVDINILSDRLKNSRRPLLVNTNKKEKLIELFNQRKKYYSHSSLIIENNKNANQVVEEIINKLKIYEKTNYI